MITEGQLNIITNPTSLWGTEKHELNIEGIL